MQILSELAKYPREQDDKQVEELSTSGKAQLRHD